MLIKLDVRKICTRSTMTFALAKILVTWMLTCSPFAAADLFILIYFVKIAVIVMHKYCILVPHNYYWQWRRN